MHDRVTFPSAKDGDFPKEIKRRASPVGLRGSKTKRHRTIDRFWARVQKNPRGCWLFIGAKTCHGGHIYFAKRDGSRVAAHRYSYQLHHGRIPPECVVMHSCDVPNCVRPSHLSLGTQKQNVHDSIIRNRRDAWGRQRLVIADVLEIRARFQAGEPQKAIAKSYGVSKGCIHAVVHGLSWAHVFTVDRRAVSALVKELEQA